MAADIDGQLIGRTCRSGGLNGRPGNFGMDSEGFAKLLGAIIAAITLVAAIVFGPIGQMGGKPAAQKIEAPKAAAPAAPVPRGPVVREVPQ